MSAGRRRSKADIERELQDLARALDTPAPDYSGRVLRTLAAHTQEPAPLPHRPSWRILSPRARRILIAAIAFLIAVAVTIAVPGSRRALASWFGFAGIEIRHAPIRTSPPPAAGLPMPLHAGAKVTLTDAHAAMAGQLWLPATLPAPTAVYLRRDRRAVVVTLAYATAPHLHPTADTGYALILTEIANAGHPLFEKILGTNTSAIMVTVARHPGVALESGGNRLPGSTARRKSSPSTPPGPARDSQRCTRSRHAQAPTPSSGAANQSPTGSKATSHGRQPWRWPALSVRIAERQHQPGRSGIRFSALRSSDTARGLWRRGLGGVFPRQLPEVGCRPGGVGDFAARRSSAHRPRQVPVVAGWPEVCRRHLPAAAGNVPVVLPPCR